MPSASQLSAIALPPNTYIRQQYCIERVLGQPGGFGITYLAVDSRLQQYVAIKEFLPRDLVGRATDQSTVVPHSAEEGELFRYGLEQFVREVQMLAKFDHPNIVKVKAFFEAHGTAYLVMDYHEGRSLGGHLKKVGGRLPFALAVEIMMRVLDGLSHAHEQGLLHRDVKPDNVYLRTSGQPLLLDFGAARQAIGERSRSLTTVLTPGYAPLEQHSRRGVQGAWTDVYACAATLYRAITGEVPPPAAERVDGDRLRPPRSLVPELPPHLDEAIVRGLAMRAPDRPQTASAFQDMLEGVASPKQARKQERKPAADAQRNVERTQPQASLEPSPPRPARRWWARVLIDAPLFAMLGWVLATSILVAISLISTPFVPDYYKANFFLPLVAAQIGILFIGPAAAVMEALSFAFFGTTPGKALFGVRVRTRAGERLSFAMAFRRAIRVWAFGQGFLVPLLAIFTHIWQYHRLLDNGETSWDKKLGLVVLHRGASVNS